MRILQLNYFHVIMTTTFIIHSTFGAFIRLGMAKGDISELTHAIMQVYYYPAGNGKIDESKCYGDKSLHERVVQK